MSGGAMNRRRFLSLAGGAAGVSALAALSQSIERAAAIPPASRTGTVRDVEHIVVLMQENRSFDHYFGSLRGVRGFGDPRPVTLPSGKPVWYQSDGSSDVLPFHPDAAQLGMQFLEDLPHDWNSGHQAFHNGAYDQWVPAKSAVTMAYLTRDDIPFHYALADAFTVCDAYHCSLIGPTDPNRYHMWTGYVGNDGTGGGPVLANYSRAYSWTTYPERLQQAGISWKIYQDAGRGLDALGTWGLTEDAYIGNYGDNSLLNFRQYRDARRRDPLYENARTGTHAWRGQDLFGILADDVKSGNLPQVSWIVAPEAFSEHPNWPANYGAWYVANVLDALTADPDVWASTTLLIAYDENDGFFDHVVPPYPPPSPAYGSSTVDVSEELFGSIHSPSATDDDVPGPYGLGPRVPMLVVSPWSTGGWVCSEVFDHTSLIRFMEQRFGVVETNITPWRRAVCGDLTAAFDFARSDTALPTLPPTDGYQPPDHRRHRDYVPTVPDNPSPPSQEPGVRPARPLPYDLAADARLDGGTLSIRFASNGTAGACWQVTSSTDPSGPWSYTAAAGAALTGQWSVTGDYDFTVHGPNGFFRRFTGTAATAEPEVAAHHDASGEVRLAVTNPGRATVRLTVTDAYRNADPATYRLGPGERLTHTADPSRTAGWYELSVTCTERPGYLRRLAGHRETGKASTTDPAATRAAG